MPDYVARCHAIVDQITDRIKAKTAAADKPVTCLKGCSACCSEPVYADKSEAIHILEIMTEEEITVLKVKVARWLKHIRKSPLLAERMPHVITYRLLGLKCPLLKDNLCSVYERRPFSCREHYAIGNPELCGNNKKRLNQTFVIVQNQPVEPMLALMEGQPFLLLDHLMVHMADILLGDPVPESQAKHKVEIEK